MVSERDVTDTFRALFGGVPTSAGLAAWMKTKSLENLIKKIVDSVDYQRKTRPGPLWNYTATYDPITTIMAHDFPQRKAVPGHRVNYLGVAVNVDRFFTHFKLKNIVEPPPIPANWHTDLAELSAALRAVDAAGDEFSIVELGCGWGCWMNITGTAARRRGKKVALIGVEGDKGHVAFAHESMRTNGFAPTDYQVHWGVAAAVGGVAFFPAQAAPGSHWGLQPIFAPTAEEEAKLRASGHYEAVRMISLEEILRDRPHLDLLHVDIQGGETALVRGALGQLNAKVRRMVIGTHSRVIDGQIIETLLDDGGWELEIERPCIFDFANGRLRTRIDGVQGWRNKRLAVGGA